MDDFDPHGMYQVHGHYYELHELSDSDLEVFAVEYDVAEAIEEMERREKEKAA